MTKVLAINSKYAKRAEKAQIRVFCCPRVFLNSPCCSLPSQEGALLDFEKPCAQSLNLLRLMLLSILNCFSECMFNRQLGASPKELVPIANRKRRQAAYCKVVETRQKIGWVLFAVIKVTVKMHACAFMLTLAKLRRSRIHQNAGEGAPLE